MIRRWVLWLSEAPDRIAIPTLMLASGGLMAAVMVPVILVIRG